MSDLRGIKLSGLSDEAGPELADQIEAHHKLGWSEIEIRSVKGLALGDWDSALFNQVRSGISDASLKVTSVASRIANWERPITSDFEQDLEELRRISERMQLLGAKYVRIMSYPNDGLPETEWRERVFDRIHKLTELASEANIILLHENCSGWAGTDPERALQLIEGVNSPHLRLLFDTGNGIAYRYHAFDYLTRVWPYVEHVHIKDGILQEGKEVYTLPGEGDSKVKECLIWLLEHNYDGILSIEPHLHLIPHLRQSQNSRGYQDSYIAYGQRLEKLLEEIRVSGEKVKTQA
ncbi:sugar phosphate isomerase/epimerase family protein [Paenibacillus sp. YPG26]|uniref:sugar phosphate isomerase/epimerase family protein n=1 Tax=Paenibacillus sp. YPG26 TaxID=2878915 RepID=UPI0020413BB5|nr:sugar phosphate isomerase/epimerase family protein [Paenibacillus sp. YPG26]USB31713.1 sugar phosphate isomerase/epimerase [Paenibacillus sp. YPG26]